MVTVPHEKGKTPPSRPRRFISYRAGLIEGHASPNRFPPPFSSVFFSSLPPCLAVAGGGIWSFAAQQAHPARRRFSRPERCAGHRPTRIWESPSPESRRRPQIQAKKEQEREKTYPSSTRFNRPAAEGPKFRPGRILCSEIFSLFIFEDRHGYFYWARSRGNIEYLTSVRFAPEGRWIPSLAPDATGRRLGFYDTRARWTRKRKNKKTICHNPGADCVFVSRTAPALRAFPNPVPRCGPMSPRPRSAAS